MTGACTTSLLLGMRFDDLGTINENPSSWMGRWAVSEVPRPGGPGGCYQRNAGRGDVDERLRGESSRGPLRHCAELMDDGLMGDGDLMDE